ncbi:hypothetical protein HPC49_26035 [Pyxidicoccus fallax]|uniref:LamG domain-containing protein n=1 Tax=Pyxidicoccus fallax TaxID=394095 RepID=A0A848LD85_9BACT|nr:LamG domain-containing protein [Pyxidicoccus fallax]NPC81667.1 hypothetical protein [Pyxidicoccus fallax]
MKAKWPAVLLGGFVLLQPLSGFAAPGDWFSDDFESGTLRSSDSPPGRWDQTAVVSPNTLASRAEGAHRGRYGLTVSDSTSTAGSLASVIAVSDTLASEFHVRTWLRLRSVTASGRIILMQAHPALVELRLLEQGTGLIWELSVRNGPEPTYFSLHGSRVEPGRWYLVEFSVRGLGTTSGEARLWVDGVAQGSPLSGRDWNHSEYVFNEFQVGEPWSDTGTFKGFIDFDDVRVSAAPMASRLELRRPAVASSGCIAVDVALRSSAAAVPAPAPYATDVDLRVTGNTGTFHSDEGCKVPVKGALLPLGASERRVYFRPGGTAGRAMLEASHPDFLPAKLDLEVDAGVGPDAVPDEDGAEGPWTTDLGCASAPGALLALPFLLVPWLRRRRERRTPR